MNKPLVWMGQAVLYAALAAVILVFTRWPSYQNLPADSALIKLSISHQGKVLGDCVELTPEELAKLPPNMRAPVSCPRERSPLTVEIDVDGELAYRQVAQPSGLSSDGAAVVYHRIEVPAGAHAIEVRMKDDARSEGFDYTRSETVTLAPAEILVVDFDAAERRIILL
ncbi:hypothetical protein [Dokdonella sp.]|mgnify:FL=1|jgi:hypothetical protein|uniref:hypothetical protein n=1 Tax=Dokdonella sp. TaxID=2291710 RepID=UPI002C884952|nr:hypothetical protein [Rhodanobacteraceae bacterium]HQX33516.1 hypothetical protein [Dokdonella sp.]